MKNWIHRLLLCSLLLVCTPALMGSIDGRRVEYDYFEALAVAPAATATFARIPVDKTEFHSLAYEISVAGAIDVDIDIEAGFRHQGAAKWFQPIHHSTSKNFTGTASISGLYAIALPVCEFVRVKVTNNGGAAIDIDGVYFLRQ